MEWMKQHNMHMDKDDSGFIKTPAWRYYVMFLPGFCLGRLVGNYHLNYLRT
jgi:hypothetical protein